MKNWKIAVVTCTYLVTVPALAAEQPKNPPVASGVQPQTQQKKEETPTSFDKKTYMEHVANSFEFLDRNRDGRVDAKELREQGDNIYEDDGSISSDVDDDVPEARSQIQSPNRPSETVKTEPETNSGGAGIPPINAGQLLK